MSIRRLFPLTIPTFGLNSLTFPWQPWHIQIFLTIGQPTYKCFHHVTLTLLCTAITNQKHFPTGIQEAALAVSRLTHCYTFTSILSTQQHFDRLQTLMVASSLAETITLNTGWNATRVTGPRWPVRLYFSGGRGIQSDGFRRSRGWPPPIWISFSVSDNLASRSITYNQS